MANGDMLDFTQALSELQMSEAELQNLIAKGELRAFRSGGTMKFRKADVNSLKNERATEPTIIIPVAGSGAAFNSDVPQDLGVDESAATVVPDISPGGSAPTVNLGGSGQSGTEEIVFEDSDLQILPLDGDSSAADVTVTAEDPVSLPMDEAPPERKASRRSSRREDEALAPAGGGSRRVQAAFTREPGTPAFSGMLIFTSLMFAIVGSIFAVMLWKGYYNETKKAAYVPQYLQGAQKSAAHWFDPQ
jgi:hypothetical protein